MTLLITGATGFLGGSVAAQAIHAANDTPLRFLVRAPSRADGLDRLKLNLEGYGVPPDQLARLTGDNIILGDLLDGLAITEADRLAEVTRCIHSAAIVSFSNNPRIAPVNVQGSVDLATCLMRHARDLDRFVYVGTAMACGAQQGTTDVAEQDVLDPDAAHLVPYTASKATAERELRALLPAECLVVARPSIIVGDRVHGCANSQSIYWVFLMAQILGCFTVDPDEKIDVIPVDYAAAAVLFLATKNELAFSTYNVSAGVNRSNRFREIDETMARARGVAPAGPNYRKVGAGDLAGLMTRAQKLFPDIRNRLILHAVKLYGAFAALNYTFANARLAAEGFAPPPFLTDYLSHCVETARNIPLAEQMKWDFK
jgi:nucleoside-diphosphate-sugar epimerase